MEFVSEEYIKKVMERTNADEKYLELAKEENASYTFMFQAEPDKGVEKDMVFGYNAENGVMTDVWLGEKKTELVISGKYGVWVNILIGKTGATKAFLMRKLKVRGNLMKILKLQEATERWLEILRTIPTEFHGEYAKYNIKG